MEGGRPRFGTWFAQAPGSGIFLNVGRSYRIASKGKHVPLHGQTGHNDSHQYRQLVAGWAWSRNLTTEAARVRIFEWAHKYVVLAHHGSNTDDKTTPCATLPADDLAFDPLSTDSGSLQVWGDAFALMAFDLGFDTVQVGAGSDGAGAGIPSLQVVHLSPPTHGPTAADRPPRFVSRGRGMGACGIGIEFRQGWRHDRPCHCDPLKAILNCDAAAR